MLVCFCFWLFVCCGIVCCLFDGCLLWHAFVVSVVDWAIGLLSCWLHVVPISVPRVWCGCCTNDPHMKPNMSNHCLLCQFVCCVMRVLCRWLLFWCVMCLLCHFVVLCHVCVLWRGNIIIDMACNMHVCSRGQPHHVDHQTHDAMFKWYNRQKLHAPIFHDYVFPVWPAGTITTKRLSMTPFRPPITPDTPSMKKITPLKKEKGRTTLNLQFATRLAHAPARARMRPRAPARARARPCAPAGNQKISPTLSKVLAISFFNWMGRSS